MLSDVIGMFLTIALIAVQFYFGQKQKLRLGLILPILLVVIFAIMCLVDGSPLYLIPGGMCVLGLLAAYFMGTGRAKARQKAELDKMKSKDL